MPAENPQPQGHKIDLWYSGKTHDFGGNIQACFTRPGYRCGFPGAAGNVHDLAAARENVLGVLRPFLAACRAGRPWLRRRRPRRPRPGEEARRGQELDISTRARNALIRSARCLGERGFALLTQRWRTLQHVTASPGRIGLIARAALVLVLFEHKMIK